MAGPWEKYEKKGAGPWEKYKDTPTESPREPKSPYNYQSGDYGRALLGAGEAALDIAGKAITLPLAGYAGLMSLGSGVDAAADAVTGVMGGRLSSLTAPRTDEGRAFSSAIASSMEPIAELTDIAGEKAGDVAGFFGGSPEVRGGIASSVKTILEGGPALFGRNLGAKRGGLTNKQTVLKRAQESGYVVPSSDAVPESLARGYIEGAAGKPRMQMDASLRNQRVTNELAAESLGLAPGTEITAATLKRVRNEAGLDYEVLNNSGVIVADTSYRRALSNVRKDVNKGTKTFKSLKSKEIESINEIIDDLDKFGFGSDDAIGAMRRLRELADEAYDNSRPSLGAAYKGLSKAIEDAAERNLARGRDPSIVERFRAARRRIAKSYTIQDALDGDGYVSAQRLAKAKQDGVPLDENLMLIADFAEQFPKSSRVMKETPIATGRLSTLAGAGGAGSMLGGDPILGSMLMSAAFGGPLVRRAMLSKPGQAAFAGPYGPRLNPQADTLGLLGTTLLTDDRDR